MGNEFGHPEWIDFPREGNNWSYKYARRQWSLADNPDLKYGYLNSFEKEMLLLQHKSNLIGNPEIVQIAANEHDKIIAFMRGDYLFVFNFHPSASYSGYGLAVKGRFEIVLDTDDTGFGGFGRIDKSMIYTATKPEGNYSINAPFWLHLYLPARVGMVLKKQPVRNIRDLPKR
jgi:1,4-alpha-glucan branching enzyme